MAPGATTPLLVSEARSWTGTVVRLATSVHLLESRKPVAMPGLRGALPRIPCRGAGSLGQMEFWRDSISPRRRGRHMVIGEAFFDESGTNDDDKNLCLGGYVFVGNAAATFEVEWRAMLAAYGLQRFHMREFRQQNKGVFKHLTAEQREQALLDAIKIIQTHASSGMAFSIDKADLGAITKGSPWSKSYSFLANQTFYGIERLLGGEEAGEVNYVFEHGAEGWGEAEKVFKDAKSEPALGVCGKLHERRDPICMICRAAAALKDAGRLRHAAQTNAVAQWQTQGWVPASVTLGIWWHSDYRGIASPAFMTRRAHR